MLSVNEILMAKKECTVFEGVVRVVAAAADSGAVALMRLDLHPFRAPFTVAMDDIKNSIRTDEILRVKEFANDVAISEEDLTKEQREELIRAEAHMRPLIEDKLESIIFDPKERGRAFEQRALECGITARTLRRHFYAYLWGGMTKFALIGSTKRDSKEQTLGNKRRGCAGSGPTLPEVREQVEDGVERFFLSGKYTMQEAFVLTLKKHFGNGVKLGMNSEATISLSEILKPDEQLPTKRQFRYVCDRLQAELGKRKTKPGMARIPKEEMLPTGKARDGVLGPGFRFEIDATRFQVQLASRFGRRWLVGEATVYIIIDVWSGAIVGYAVSTNPPSWEIARAALHNCFTDKGEVFKALSLPYNSADWACRELPSRLAADRAEFVGDKAGRVLEIGIKVEIMPSMCPERKGKVESEFRALKHGNNFYTLPGKHGKNPGRREDDGKSSAALTIDELERIIVEIILDLNSDPVPLKHIPFEALNAGYSAITHIGLYKWGLEHRPGYTRTLPPKDVFTHLLSRATAFATSSGINFQKQTFRSPKLRELGYTARARSIEIGYDSHCAARAWFYDDLRFEWIPADNDNEEIRRTRACFKEVELFLLEAEELRTQAKNENIHRKSEKSKRINTTTNTSIAEAKAERRALTKTQAKAEIRINSSVERRSERDRRADDMAEKYGPQNEEPSSLEKAPPVNLDLTSNPNTNPHKSIGRISRDRWLEEK